MRCASWTLHYSIAFIFHFKIIQLQLLTIKVFVILVVIERSITIILLPISEFNHINVGDVTTWIGRVVNQRDYTY